MTVWDNGYPDGGNYWSNYTGVDEKSGPGQNQPGADGIGDSPQVITDKSTDQYPLIAPVVQNDSTPPLTKLTLTGTGGDRRWFLSEVNCTFVAQDNLAGVKTVHYRLDSGSWINYTSQVSVSGEGQHVLEFYAEDWAGISEPVRTRTIRIDTGAPQFLGSQQLELRFKDTRLTTIHYEFQDSMSGMLDYALIRSDSSYEQEGFTTITFTQLSLADGTMSYYALAQDLAGNVNTSAAIDLEVSLNENRSPSSLGGPYGPWYDVGLLVDIVLLPFMIWLSLVIMYGPVSRHREPNEIDKEEVVDGYPKFKRKM